MKGYGDLTRQQEMSVTKDDFIAKWQELHVEGYHLLNGDNQPTGQCKAEKHADIIRNTMCHLQFANLCNVTSSTCTNHMFLKYADVYGTLIDSPLTGNDACQHLVRHVLKPRNAQTVETIPGLDNFAELVLSQNESRLNESQKWKSSLTLTSITDKGYIKEIPSHPLPTEDTLLPVSTKPAPQITQQAAARSATSSIQGLNMQHTVGSGCQLVGQTPDYRSSGANTNLTKPNKPSLFGGIRISNDGQNCWNFTADGQGSSKELSAIRPCAQHPTSELDCSESYLKTKNRSIRNQSTKRPWNCEDDIEGNINQPVGVSAFRTAKQQLMLTDQMKQCGGGQSSAFNYGTNKKSLGTRRGLNSKFVPPVLNRDEEKNDDCVVRRLTTAALGKKGAGTTDAEMEVTDERLKNIDPKMIELITNEIMDHGPPVTWNDIAGLEFAKKTIKEIVVWPMLRRKDIFTGLRGPPKGLLLFGPPGTGKTLIGKCIASQSKSTFFSISASSLTSKWVGEGEKMVRALFGVARVYQPAVIFIDEIDSLLSRRTDGEHEGSRRIKTEFLIQLEGATTTADDRILVVGATNRPQEIDEAARRRFVKRLYIPLPETGARKQIVLNLMSQQLHSLMEEEVHSICVKSEGYSGSDMANLCREAALGPIRSMPFEDIENIKADQVRPVVYQDFMDAFKQVRASVSQKDLNVYIDWNKEYGSWPI